jgi:hypothetical protein
LPESATLAEGLQGRQTLDCVQIILSEGAECRLTHDACRTIGAMRRRRQGQGEQSGDEHDGRDRQVPSCDENEDDGRSRDSETDLRQVLAEERLELLDPVHHRERDPAGAFGAKGGGAQFHEFVMQAEAQRGLDAGGRTVRDYGAGVIKQRTNRDGGGGAERESGHGKGGRVTE